MNKTKMDCSMNDTTVLRNLILENPDLPLLIFCGEEAWGSEYGYEQADAGEAEVKELTLYRDCWLDRDDYEKELADDMGNEEEYKYLSDEAFDAMLDKKVKETEFVKAIVIYVG